MLVHFIEPEWCDAYDGLDYDAGKILVARKVKSYDRFIKLIKSMKGKDIIIEDGWYTIDSYALSFPQDREMAPCLKVFVVSY